MKRILALISLVLFSSNAWTFSKVTLYKSSLKKLSAYKIQSQLNVIKQLKALASEANALQALNQTKDDSKIVTRYQQFYKGIPVVGAQVMVTQNADKTASEDVNGYVIEGIQLNTVAALSKLDAIQLAKQTASQPTSDETATLEIREDADKQLKLVYLVSFKTAKADNKPSEPFFIIDAESGDILSQWDNIKTYRDSGPGGNEKVHEYWYGKDGLPSLDLVQNGRTCVMDNGNVRLVHLGFLWDWNDSLLSAYEYPCGENTEEYTNGGYSPVNDAYYFGNTIVYMYRGWYGLNVLQNPNGSPMQLVMRAHFGQGYDNAFWNGRTMSFGDGYSMYPLVSLDVAGHEVTHGFTAQHSNLEYHDESGAINESMSDMGGQAARAYLLEKQPNLYNRAYLIPNVITWGVGETIMREGMGRALRYMDAPSLDNQSADCLDKRLAQSSG